MKLYYSHNLNPRVAVAAARYMAAPVAYVRASPMDPANREAFRPLNPNTRVPVLDEPGRPPLWEADAITCRLAALTGSPFWVTGEDQPEMIRWISWATHHLNRAADPLYFNACVMPTFTEDRLPQDELDRSLADWREFAAVLDGALEGREWLLGSAPTYADFRAGTALPFAAPAGLPVEDYPNVARLARQLDAIDAWREPFKGLD